MPPSIGKKTISMRRGWPVRRPLVVMSITPPRASSALTAPRSIMTSAARRGRLRDRVGRRFDLELAAELVRPPVGGPDGLRQDRPKPALLELVDRRGGGPARR